MTPKARHMHNSPHARTISVDELFAAAFNRSELFYSRESLLGWRPISDEDPSYRIKDEDQIPGEPASQFSNSPDITVHETSEAIFIEIDLPDINEDSLYLEVSGDLLMIKAEKADTDHHQSGHKKNEDRPMIHRYVKLPIHAQPGNVQARLDENQLRVIVHKTWTNLNDE